VEWTRRMRSRVVDVLLSAISKVPSAQLFLVGDGDLRPSYEALAKYLQISDRVTFLGKMSEVQLISFIEVLIRWFFRLRLGRKRLVLWHSKLRPVELRLSRVICPGVRTVVLHDYTGLLTPPSSVRRIGTGDSTDDGARTTSAPRKLNAIICGIEVHARAIRGKTCSDLYRRMRIAVLHNTTSSSTVRGESHLSTMSF
jgi:hypothetical protein